MSKNLTFIIMRSLIPPPAGGGKSGGGPQGRHFLPPPILTNLKSNTKAGPVCIRFVGNITDPSTLNKGDLLVDTVTCGLTIEGIGKDATFNGFGLVLKNSSNVEVRNIGFMNCNSSEGDNCGLQQGNDHVWVHHCDMFYGDAGSDADQVKGDGALDTKTSSYITHSYNHFWDNGKCDLQGMKSESTENYITYLVRDTSAGLRVDIPGVPAGTYSVSLTTAKGTIVQSGLEVNAQDRSGYAHFDYTAGVGAYQDNGALKPNAIVLYVTDDNKDTVSVTAKDGTTVKGIDVSRHHQEARRGRHAARGPHRRQRQGARRSDRV